MYWLEIHLMKGCQMENMQVAESVVKQGKFYTFFVDDREYHIHQETITGGEIMDMAGIPRETGLVLLNDDGTQRQVGVGEVIELQPGRRFKKAPRFKRG